jgi:peptide-methionine (R)-S-oxide reductase
MKKRYFLGAGSAAIGSVWLSQYLPGKARETSSSAATGFEVVKSEQQWRQTLTNEQFRVLRQQDTERPGSSPLLQAHGQGKFACAGCDLPLFTSETKFESGTGWPSFYAPIQGAVATSKDFLRVEVHCRRCGGHLGHVFDDGPKPTGKRYCMNGVALKFIAAG